MTRLVIIMTSPQLLHNGSCLLMVLHNLQRNETQNILQADHANTHAANPSVSSSSSSVWQALAHSDLSVIFGEQEKGKRVNVTHDRLCIAQLLQGQAWQHVSEPQGAGSSLPHQEPFDSEVKEDKTVFGSIIAAFAGFLPARTSCPGPTGPSRPTKTGWSSVSSPSTMTRGA
jgi:hypothetical protein